MLKTNNARRLLTVLDEFKCIYPSVSSTSSAYKAAVKKVSVRHDVKYQTIGDLCRRSLGLERIHDFYDLLDEWITGDPTPLKSLLEKHTRPSDHHIIADYFEEADKCTNFTLRLNKECSRKLEILTKNDRCSPSLWLRQQIQTIVGERYDKWVREEAGRKKSSESFRGKKVKSFTFLGDTFKVRHWEDVLTKVCGILFTNRGKKALNIMMTLEGRKYPWFVYNKKYLAGERGKRIPGTEMFVSTQLNNDELIRRCRLVIKKCGYNSNELKIETQGYVSSYAD